MYPINPKILLNFVSNILDIFMVKDFVLIIEVQLNCSAVAGQNNRMANHMVCLIWQISFAEPPFCSQNPVRVDEGYQ